MKKRIPVAAELGRRVREARKDLGMSQGELGEAIGLKQTGISEIELGNISRPKKLRELARVLRRSEEYLLAEVDEGTKPDLVYVPLDEDDSRAAVADRPFAATIPGSSPEVDARSGAGSGQIGREVSANGYTGHRVVDEWVLPTSFHHEMRTQAARVWIMPVIGNSMEPVLVAGDRVLVDTTHTAPSPDAIYIIDQGAGPEVKQIHLIGGANPSQIRIISINPSYPPFDRPLADIRIIGRVCGRISRM
jgi:phage repressor protein C with HTH and peptisase S24 domain